MSLNTGSLILFLTILFFIIVGVVWLQVFLSKRDSKWPGLIMPSVSLMISLLAVFGFVSFGSLELQSSNSVIIVALYVFVIYNIPTALLIAIYKGTRNKRKKNLEVENI